MVRYRFGCQNLTQESEKVKCTRKMPVLVTISNGELPAETIGFEDGFFALKMLFISIKYLLRLITYFKNV